MWHSFTVTLGLAFIHHGSYVTGRSGRARPDLALIHPTVPALPDPEGALTPHRTPGTGSQGGLIFLGPIVLKQSKIQLLAGYHLQGTAQTAD